jgi:hypothetical protein
VERKAVSDFNLGMELNADAAGLVSAGAQGERAIDGLGDAGKRAEAGLEGLERATEGTAKAVLDLTGVESRLDAVISAIQQSTRGAALGHGALRDAIVAQTNASTGATAAMGGLGSAQEAAAQDATALATAERNLAAATSEAERASASAALAALKLQQAQDGGATEKLARDMAALRAELDPVGEAERQLARNVDLANTALARGVITQGQYEQHLRDLNSTTRQTAAEVNRQGYAVRNVGQQFGDFGLQVAGGTSVARAFGQQAGQLGFALSEMGGKLGKVGAFLTGPWGIALTIGAAFAAPLIEKLFQVGHEADENVKKLELAATAADSYGNAQSLLGKVIDLTTGKLKTQNSVLIETIKLQAQANILKAQADQKSAADALRGIATPTYTEAAVGGAKAIGGVLSGLTSVKSAAKDLTDLSARLSPLKAVVTDYVNLTSIANASQDSLEKGMDATIRRIDRLAASGRLAGRDVIAAKTAVVALATTLNDQRANKMVVDAIDGKGLADDLRPTYTGSGGKTPHVKKPKSTAALDEFGRDAADKIAAFTDQLSDTPTVVRQVNDQVRKLDDLIDDLSRKKPPGFKDMIAQATALRPLIADGINKPFNEFVKSQQDSLAILKLQADGQNDQAEALRVILGLEKQVGPLTPARKDAVLATVEALKAEQRQIDINREHTGLYLNALAQIKGVVQDATQAFVRGDLGQFIKSPGKLVDAFQTLKGQQLFEGLFGDAFRKLQDQVNGTSTVEDASQRMADAVDQVSKHTDVTTKALDDLATAARGTAGALATPPGGNPPASAGAAAVAAGGQATEDPGTGDIVVTAPKRPPAITRDPTALFTQAIGGVATKLAGIFTNPETAGKIGKTIGSFAGKGLEGAATGSFVNGVLSPIGKALGIKTSQTGAQIGGAIGSAVPIPGGQIIGSVLGSIVGGLFKKNNKFGSSTLDLSSGRAEAGTAIGKGSAERQQADALGGSVAEGLNSIVQALGAQLGTASVSIGYRPGHKAGAYRVDTTGGGKVTGVEAFDTEAEAIAFAIRDAILDGGVTGLSAAVQKALGSSSDIDRAVQEALGVKALETRLGGIAGSLKAVFDTEDAAGRERVRLAKAYGVDLVAVEKLNAEERNKLVEATLKSAVGSLQDLLTDLSSGDLFEGSAADKRKAILGNIETTKARADKGEEGAADELATLYRNLLAVTREGYGTAGGEYTGDRSLVESGAASVIKAERDRIAAASGTNAETTKAIQAGNALTSESNDLLAQVVTKIDNLTGAIAIGGGTYYNVDPSSPTARNIALTA